MSDSVVIIPTYNELGNIEKMVHKVFSLSHPFHLLIIDDGSHELEHQITSREVLFERVNKGGLYIIEDIQNPEIDIPIFIEKFGI